MPTTGQLAFGSYASDAFSDGGAAWTNPSNAGASDSSRASASLSSSGKTEFLKGLGVTGGSVPTGATVTTAILRVTCRSAETVVDENARLIFNGSLVGTIKARSGTVDNTDTVHAYVFDLATDFATLTATQANAATTGAAVRYQEGGLGTATVEVNYMTMEFWYTGAALATPTLAVSDAGTGTSGTATVSSGDSGATNTLYYQSVANRGNTGWASAGSRTGDGTVSISGMTAGYYWWKVESSDGTDTVTSNLVYQPLLSSTTAIHYRCLQWTVARLQELTVSGVTTARITQQILLDLDQVTRPGIVATLNVGSEEEVPGVVGQDDVIYPVAVIYIADKAARAQDHAAESLKVREQLQRALRHSLPTGISEVHDVTISPQQVASERLMNAEIFWSGFEVRYKARMTRGLT